MTTVSQAKRYLLIARIAKIVFVIGVLSLLGFLLGPRFGAIQEALTPPSLSQPAVKSVPQRLEQGWSLEQSNKIHSISQGTRTLPVPISWLMALEQPRSSLFTVPFGRSKLFMDDDYILRFGFINSDVSESNPLGLPLGVAVTPSQNIPGIVDVADAVGFNCAACHTGHLTVGDNHVLIEGGAASVDLGLLSEAIGAALGQTLVSSRIPVFNGRFDRFARGVLKNTYSDAGVLQLKAELKSLIVYLKGIPSSVAVVEGFGRLDALNRIGNQSFAIDFHRSENYVPPNAPVNYPHIWTAPWFDWVQYDGSIMNPLVRNAGEALGVSAYINFSAPSDEGRFVSSIKYEKLKWIENTIAGSNPLNDDGTFDKFSGLTAPKWQVDIFGEIENAKVEAGEVLYKKHCRICHLRTPTDPNFGDEFSKVAYYLEDGSRQESVHSMLRVRSVPVEVIGTDPAQAGVLVNRRVDTSGDGRASSEESAIGMGLDTTVCVQIAGDSEENEYATEYPREGIPTVNPAGASPVNESVFKYRDLLYQHKKEKYQLVPIKDSPHGLFAYSLGALVQEANDRWFANNPQVSREERRVEYEKGMPNCLRAGNGYKARPLNGVWATAPYLHNGSVPTIYDLLSPHEERPRFVQLGGIEFNTTDVGLVQEKSVLKRASKVFGDVGNSLCIVDSEKDRSEKKKKTYGSRYVDGYFILDTTTPGNCNTGHEFSDQFKEGKELGEQDKGVIGPALSVEDRYAIIEFLKTQ